MPELAKSLFILDTPGQEEAERIEFAVEGLVLNFVSGSRYLGGISRPSGRVGVVGKTPSGGMGPRG